TTQQGQDRHGEPRQGRPPQTAEDQTAFRINGEMQGLPGNGRRPGGPRVGEARLPPERQKRNANDDQNYKNHQTERGPAPPPQVNENERLRRCGQRRQAALPAGDGPTQQQSQQQRRRNGDRDGARQAAAASG